MSVASVILREKSLGVLDNSILDTHLYDVESSICKITSLMTNTIAKAMYAQCDPDGNKYILLDKLINIRCTDNAHTLN